MSLANDLSAFAVTLVRLGRGLYPRVTADQRPEPKELLELYDFEGCPYCRKVREALCELDLDYLVHPVGKGSAHRAQLRAIGGTVQAPYLIDPNTGTRLYESDEIIDYLNETYGAGRRAGWSLPIPSFVDNFNSALASGVRLGRGVRCRVADRQAHLQPLTLYNMEGSPYCRKVRETLSELDLDAVIRNLPKGSPKRSELVQRAGKMQVPYLIDTNTGREMYESDDIIAYLEDTYGPRRAGRVKRAGAAGAAA